MQTQQLLLVTQKYQELISEVGTWSSGSAEVRSSSQPSHPSHPHTPTPSHHHTITLSHPHTITPSHPHTITPSHPHRTISSRSERASKRSTTGWRPTTCCSALSSPLPATESLVCLCTLRGGRGLFRTVISLAVVIGTRESMHWRRMKSHI